jgi:hypothetical protein
MLRLINIARLTGMGCLLLLGGCSYPIDVSSQYDARADFGVLHTYAWTPNSDMPGDASRPWPVSTSQKIRSEVDAALASKGMRKVDPDKADALLEFWMTVGEQNQTVRMFFPQPMGARTGHDQWVYRYERGELAVTMTDRSSSRLLWRSEAQGELPKGSGGVQIAPAVAKMFAQFPPPPE